MAYLHRIALAFLLTAVSVAAHAETCSAMVTRLTASGAAWDQSVATNYQNCLNGGNQPNYCGGSQSGWSIESRVTSGVNEKRLQRWYKDAVVSGGGIIYSPLAWGTCTSPVDDYCTTISGSSAGPRVQAVSSYSGKVGTSATLCNSTLGPLADGSAASCAMSGEFDMCGVTVGSTQAYCWSNSMRYTGATCVAAGSPADAPATAPSPIGGTPGVDPPPQGKCPGTVNGVAVWVSCTTIAESTPTRTTATSSTPAGATETVAKTGTSTTTCVNGTCTTSSTTVTSVTSAGSTTVSTTTGTTAITQGSYCTLNPNALMCGGEDKQSVFGGGCTSGYACTGDAIECAIAKAASDMQCKFFEKTSAESTLYDSTKTNTTTTGLGTSSVAISGSSFSQVNLLGTGAGMSDRTVTIQGTGWSKTVTLPFSNVNAHLLQFGNLLVAVSMILAMRIVFRRDA